MIQLEEVESKIITMKTGHQIQVRLMRGKSKIHNEYYCSRVRLLKKGSLQVKK